MSLLVKICGLSDKLHVEAAIKAGAGAVGFVFTESVRKIAPDKANEICVNVPQHIKRVAVMLHPSNDDWQEVLESFAPDVLQTDADDFAALDVPESVERWPVYREGHRYDGSLEDIFDLQDQITASVVGAIAPKLERAEIERIKHKPTSSLDANDYYLRGMAAFYRWASRVTKRSR